MSKNLFTYASQIRKKDETWAGAVARAKAEIKAESENYTEFSEENKTEEVDNNVKFMSQETFKTLRSRVVKECYSNPQTYLSIKKLVDTTFADCDIQEFKISNSQIRWVIDGKPVPEEGCLSFKG